MASFYIMAGTSRRHIFGERLGKAVTCCKVDHLVRRGIFSNLKLLHHGMFRSQRQLHRFLPQVAERQTCRNTLAYVSCCKHSKTLWPWSQYCKYAPVTVRTLSGTAVGDLSSKCADAVSLLNDVSEHFASREIQGREVSQYLTSLHEVVYGNLSEYPWIHNHNASLSYMQLLMNDKLESTMAGVLEHPAFKLLLDWLEKNTEQIATDDLVRCLMTTLWLSVDKTSPAVTAMFLEIHNRLDSITLSAIVELSDALRALRRFDILLVSKLLQRFVDLSESMQERNLTSSEFVNLCQAGTNLWNFLSNDKAEEISLMLAKWLRTLDNVSDLAVISTYCRFSKRLKARHDPSRIVAVDAVVKILKDLQDSLKPQHIAEIAHSLKTSALYTPEIAAILQKHSLSMLQVGQLQKIGEITNACYSFNRGITDNERHLIERKLFDHMGDADVLVLSNIADVLVDIDCRNVDVIQRFGYMVIQHKVHLLNFVTRLSKVLRFLNLSQCVEISQNEELYEAIFQQLYQQQGIHVWSISHLANFLLRNMNHVVPSRLQERLVATIPQCDLSELYQIMLGLSKIRRPRVRTMQSQIQDLQALVHSNVMRQVEKISTLDMLHQMVVTLCLRWDAKDLVLLDALMDQFPKFTKNMNQAGFMKTLNCLNQLVYFSPRVLEDLTSYALLHHQDLGIDRFCHFLHTLAVIGYVPKDVEKLTQVSAQMFEESSNLLDIPAQLKFALDLCKLQIFPETLLNSIFTVEFIEDVDNYINENRDGRPMVEKTFMELNRCVVLECPSLDIPWFHEQYCQENPQTHPEMNNQRLRQFVFEVEKVLEELLGGRKNFSVNCLSAHYHYPIDFECLLNSSGAVIPHSSADSVQGQEPGVQRVAVLTLNRYHYCCNDRRLTGRKQMVKRHLEIMGYRVVQVPMFYWFSMALTEYPAKMDYLRDKIFK